MTADGELRKKTEALFQEKVRKFDENAGLIADLQRQLERAKQLDSHLNTELCLISELLGYLDPEAAAQAVRRRSKGKAA